MATPTAKLIDRMKSREGWDAVIDDVPIFRAHEMWQVGHGEHSYKVPVLPGKQPPRGGKFLYRVDEKKLKLIAEAINENLSKSEKAIKLFAGHTSDPTDQKKQPQLVGFGGEAKVGTWGPEKIPAVLNRWFIEKGMKPLVKNMPERSPEFYPSTNEITAVALLATDPKLPMGMLTYTKASTRSDGAVLYGREAMGQANGATKQRRGQMLYTADGKPVGVFYDKDDKGHGFDENDDLERNAAMARLREKGELKDYAEGVDDPNQGNETPEEREKEHEEELAELTPEEAHTAARYAAHYEKHHPAFKDMCSKYAAAMASAGPANDELPQHAPPEAREKKAEAEEDPNKKKKDEESEKMQRQQNNLLVKLSRELAQTRGELKHEKVEKHMASLRRDYLIGEKADARLREEYMKAEPEQWARIDEIVTENYQRKGESADPTLDPWLGSAPVDYEAERERQGGELTLLEQYDHTRDFHTAERYMRQKGYSATNPEQWDEAVEFAVKQRKGIK